MADSNGACSSASTVLLLGLVLCSLLALSDASRDQQISAATDGYMVMTSSVNQMGTTQAQYFNATDKIRMNRIVNQSRRLQRSFQNRLESNRSTGAAALHSPPQAGKMAQGAKKCGSSQNPLSVGASLLDGDGNPTYLGEEDNDESAGTQGSFLSVFSIFGSTVQAEFTNLLLQLTSRNDPGKDSTTGADKAEAKAGVQTKQMILPAILICCCVIVVGLATWYLCTPEPSLTNRGNRQRRAPAK